MEPDNIGCERNRRKDDLRDAARGKSNSLYRCNDDGDASCRVSLDPGGGSTAEPREPCTNRSWSPTCSSSVCPNLSCMLRATGAKYFDAMLLWHDLGKLAPSRGTFIDLGQVRSSWLRSRWGVPVETGAMRLLAPKALI
jgi:hypothetical protein